ncbi:MAG: hypothetical protein AAF909_11335 [Pseudomonadota bacterium]
MDNRAEQLIQRYLDGEHEVVWAELVDYGPIDSWEWRREAGWAIACETMERVARNLRSIVDRLRSSGYDFEDPAAALTDPPPDVEEKVDALEREAGFLPLSVKAFFIKVGGVNLLQNMWKVAEAQGGCCPASLPQELSSSHLGAHDPLHVRPVEAMLGEATRHREDLLRQAWLAHAKGRRARPIPLTDDLVLGPDPLDKVPSCQGPFGVAAHVKLPSLMADAVMKCEPLDDTAKENSPSPERRALWRAANPLFVDYLRASLAQGGFRGVWDAELQRFTTPPQSELVAQLMEYFEPF